MPMAKDYKFFVNKVKLTSASQFITGLQIKEMAHVPTAHELYLKVSGNQDKLISDEATVNLELPGVEHFYTKEPESGIVLIINGTPCPYGDKKVTFEQIVQMAFPNKPTTGDNVGFTVTYSKGPEQNVNGVMSPSSSVFVKNQMQFNVTATHKS